MARYFIMEEIENNVPRLPADNTENARLIKVPNFNLMPGLDYIAVNGLISDRLKQLMELYLPEYDFIPVVYLDSGTMKHLTFWMFQPPLFEGFGADCGADAPVVFSARPVKGISPIAVHLAVAESILRRGILGLKFTRLN